MSGPSWNDRAAEAGVAIAFLTRIPLRPSLPLDQAVLARAVWSFPLVGGLVGVVGGTVFAAGVALGLSAWLAGTLAVLAQILLTGGLHEDGLADSADGLGGRDRDHRLAIMRDSTIGSYGVLALAIALALRAGALAALADPWAVAAALLLSGVLSRAAVGLLMYMLAPARSDGLGAGAGRPGRGPMLSGWLLAVLLCLPASGPMPVVLAATAVLAATVFIAALARRRLGGQTGDVLGANQQVTECVCLLVFCTALSG